MPQVTYFMVQTFAPARRGRIVPGEARAARSAAEAVHLAERLGAAAGAVALARTCDPSVGGAGDTVILARVGDLPAEALEWAARLDGD
ncbi:hypothetical protein [Labrys wisconsinensis]|uniref:Uncharacterized protein n=1 Tax=Labrys wisconsinensis TaxID=425677 RepID=A0ABU0JG05_9HYPH|nr:hypothetical protein [Labrys wisconsinensis]MDQ0473213.1 hypothetical protein [Labrys wisconsinensis]